MISGNNSSSIAVQDDTRSFRKNLLLSTISFLVIAGISMVGSESLDYGWTGVLIIAAILAWKFKTPAMYIVYAAVMGWAATVDTLSIIFGQGTDRWWTLLGLIQIAWIVLILRQYKKYRHLGAENRALISSLFAKGSAIISGITLFLPPCTGIGWVLAQLILNNQVSAVQPGFFDQLFTPAIFTLAYLAVLALGLGLAAIIPEKNYTGLALFGVLMSLLVLVGVWALILLGLIGEAIS